MTNDRYETVRKMYVDYCYRERVIISLEEYISFLLGKWSD